MAVYFIACDLVGLVKIGLGQGDAAARMQGLRTQCPVPLRMAALDLYGDEMTEAELHFRFRDQRQHGEWFTHTGPVLEASRVTAETGRIPGGVYLSQLQATAVRAAYHRKTAWENLCRVYPLTLEEVSSIYRLQRTVVNYSPGDGLPPKALARVLEAIRLRRPDTTFAELVDAACDPLPAPVEPLSMTYEARRARTLKLLAETA